MPPILTCSLLKTKGGGGLPSPWQRSSTVSPSLTKPWGDSFHSSTIVGGSRHTHRIKLSRLIQLKSLYISITLTAQTAFGSVGHGIAAEPLQTLTSTQIMWLLSENHAALLVITMSERVFQLLNTETRWKRPVNTHIDSI